MKEHKALKTRYKLSHRPMGVFLIRNIVSDKIFLGAGHDLTGTINRNKFQLRSGRHPNRALQTDWDHLGAEKFAFEILDQISHADNPEYDPERELTSLKQLWLEKLKPFGDRGYNERPQTRDEKLRRMAARRLNEV